MLYKAYFILGLNRCLLFLSVDMPRDFHTAFTAESEKGVSFIRKGRISTYYIFPFWHSFTFLILFNHFAQTVPKEFMSSIEVSENKQGTSKKNEILHNLRKLVLGQKNRNKAHKQLSLLAVVMLKMSEDKERRHRYNIWFNFACSPHHHRIGISSRYRRYYKVSLKERATS